MGRPFASCPCAINGGLLLFLPILFWIVILKHFLEHLFNSFHSNCISTCYCGDVVRTFSSFTDSSDDGDWYKGPIWLMNYFFVSCTMISTMALLKQSVPYVGWLLIQSSSCWVMNGEKFAYILSISGFLRQVFIVSLKNPYVCTLSYNRRKSWISFIISLLSSVKSFPPFSGWKRSAIGVSVFQHAVMEFKLAVRL